MSPENFNALLSRAESGDAEAQFTLARKYDTGDGISRDSTKAVIWYRKAAKQNHITAQYNLAHILVFESSILNEHKEARYWCIKAADTGDQDAEYLLGFMCQRGIGGSKDLILAICSYTKAAKQGNSSSQLRLGDIYRTNEDVKNLKESLYWYMKAAENGNEKAQKILGLNQSECTFSKRSIKKLDRWHRQAAKEEVEEEMHEISSDVLEQIYSDGFSVAPAPSYKTRTKPIH